MLQGVLSYSALHFVAKRDSRMALSTENVPGPRVSLSQHAIQDPDARAGFARVIPAVNRDAIWLALPQTNGVHNAGAPMDEAAILTLLPHCCTGKSY